MMHTAQPSQNAFHTVDHHNFTVTGLPAFNDNYIWLIKSAKRAPGQAQDVAVVDPGDAAPVIDYCRQHGVVPAQIWLTHHHADHTGGVADLLAWIHELTAHPVAVYGPAVEEIPCVTHPLHGGEQLRLGDTPVDVLSIPGHTRGHLAYFLGDPEGNEPPALLSGDALFGLGCGRLFEGTAAQMFASLGQIAALPATTRVYCAHEYTLFNLPFALAVDPENVRLKSRAETIRRLRQHGEPTVPLTLAEECATNPFLRGDQGALRVSAMVADGASPVDVFTRLRQMRDTFKAPQ